MVGAAQAAAYAYRPDAPKPLGDPKAIIPSTTPGDIGRSFMGGAIEGLGAIAQGGGILLSEGINRGAQALGLPSPELRAINPLKTYSDAIRDARTAGGKLAEQLSTPSGDLFDPATWSFGENPTVGGVAQWASGVFGQFAPQVLMAFASGGASTVARVGLDVAVPGLQALGADAAESGHKVRSMTETELLNGSAFYRDLIAQGVRHDDAKEQTARVAELGGGLAGSVPAALAGPLENMVLRGGVRFPSLGKTAILRAASASIAGGVGATFEGAQEVAEGMATRAGANYAAGMEQPLTAGTFGEFAGGAVGGGTVSAGVSLLRGATPSGPAAPAPGGAPGAPPSDAPVPAQDLLGTEQPEPAAPAQGGAPLTEPTGGGPPPPGGVPVAAAPPQDVTAGEEQVGAISPPRARLSQMKRSAPPVVSAFGGLPP